jgi:ubiquinone biosynthesis protein UbiJ
MTLNPAPADRSLADTMRTWLFIDENGMPCQPMQEQMVRHVRELEQTVARLRARLRQLCADEE